MTSYVLIFCTSQCKDDVLLVLKDKPAWQVGLLNLPGGKIENGETPVEAATRELKEETGYEPLTEIRKMGIIQDGSNRIFCMKAVVSNEIGPRPNESETQLVAWYKWIQVKDDKRLIPNLKVIVPLIQNSVSDWVIGDTYRSHNKSRYHGDKRRHTFKISVSS
jgi:8-oxo-dGTP diphosphatase